MTCPYCSATIQQSANFCPNCGRPVARSGYQDDSPPEKTRPRFDIFLISIFASLVLSFILMTVFNLPIFILGAFLPFIGFRMRGHRS